jgi:hypothetical protein
MARITIEISLKDNELYYQDSESHSGFKIETHVKPEDEIEWVAEPGSGIKDIKKLDITGTPGFFEKEPSRVSATQWNARVGNIVEGKVTYVITYLNGSKSNDSLTQTSAVEQLNDEKSPVIMLP